MSESRQRDLSGQLAALGAISSSFSQSLTLDELLASVLNRVLETMACDAGLVSLVNPQTGKLVLSAHQGLPQAMCEQFERKGLDDTLCALVLEDRVGLGIGDLAEGAPVDVSGLLAAGWRAYLGTPLVVRGKKLGTLCAFDRHPRRVTEADLVLMRAIGGQIAVAVENARLLGEAQRRTEELALVNRVVLAVVSSSDLHTSLDIIAAELARAFSLGHVGIALLNETRTALTVVADQPLGPEDSSAVGVVLPVEDNPSSQEVIATRRPLVIPDAQNNPLTAPVHDVMRWRGVQTIVILPLLAGDEVIGTVGLDILEADRTFTADEVQLAETIVAQAATAIQKARLFEQTQQRAQELEAINEVGRTMASVLDLNTLLGQIVDMTKSRFGQYFVGIALVEGDRLVFRSGSTIGDSDARHEGAHIDLAHGPSLNAEATRTGRPVLVNDVLSDPRYLEAPELPATRSELVVPIEIKGQVIGVLDVQSDRPHAFDQSEVALLQSLAGQVVAAIENARLFEEARQVTAQMGQRVKELDCLNDIGRKINESPPLPEFLQWVAERIPPALQYPGLCLAAIEFEGQEYGMAEAVSLPCQIVQALHIGGEVVGRIYVAYTQERDFLDEESALLGDIARRVSGYIENRRLLQETQARAEELAVLNELGQALTTRLKVEQVMDEAYRGVSRLVEASDFYIGLYDPERDEINFAFDVTESVQDLEITVVSADQGLAGYIIRNRTSVLLGDNVRARQEALGIEMVGEEPLSWLGVPLIVGDQVLGVMAVQSFTTPRLYDEHDRDLLTAIASSMAIALQNAYLFEETQAALTETENLAEALQVSEERFTLAMQGSNDGLWDWDIANDSLYWSPRFKELLGYADDELDVDFDVFETHLHPDDSEHTGVAIEAHLEDGGPYDVEQRLLTKSGDYRWFRARGEAVRDETGKPIRMTGFTTDITARKQAEEALRQSEEKYRTIIESVQEGYYEVDLAGNFVFFNDALCGILGYPKDKLRGMNNRQYMDKESAEKVYQAFNAVYRTGKPVNVFNWGIIRKDGSRGVTEASVSLIRDSWGEPVGFRGVVRDVTERRRAEAERERLLAETENLAGELAVLNELGQALTARLSVDEVLEEAFRQTSRLVDTTNFFIGFYDPERDEINFAFDVSESEIDKHITVMPASQGLTGYIVRNRTSVLLGKGASEWEQEMGIETVGQEAPSWLGVPMLIGDQTLGVMVVQSYTTPSLYDEHDRDLLTAIASSTAIAIQNARLFEQTQAALEQVRAVHQRYLRESWQDYLDARGRAAQPAYLYDQAQIKPLPALQSSEIDRALVQKELILVGDGEEGGQIIALPISLRGQPIGALAVEPPPGGRPWNEEEIALVESVATQLALAIENARLFEQTLRRAHRERLVREITDRIRGQTGLDAILQTTVVELGKALGTSHTAIRLGTETELVSPLAAGR